MGFIEDVRFILSKMTSRHQTLLFSATMPKTIMELSKDFMNDYKLIKTMSDEDLRPDITEYATIARENEKLETLIGFLDVQNPNLAIVFGRTKRRVDELSSALIAKGYLAEGLHGDITQSKRLEILRKFKNNSLQILVATDVAARGIDISDVTHVYNFDIPQDVESYTHRIGRTGRAGKSGVATTFLNPVEMPYLKDIENSRGERMKMLRPYSQEEVKKSRHNRLFEEVISEMDNNHVEFNSLANKLLAETNAEKVITILLSKLITDKKDVDVELSFEKPLPRRQEKGRRSNRGNDRRRRSENRRSESRGSDKREKKNRNERRGTDKKFFDKKGRRMQNK